MYVDFERLHVVYQVVSDWETLKNSDAALKKENSYRRIIISSQSKHYARIQTWKTWLIIPPTKSFGNSDALQQTHEGNQYEPSSKILHRNKQRQKKKWLLSCISWKLERIWEVKVEEITSPKKIHWLNPGTVTCCLPLRSLQRRQRCRLL